MSTIQKSYIYEVYRNGTYLGNLPNVTSDFSYPQDINTAGSQLMITCGISADTSRLSNTILTAEDTTILTSESGLYLTTERYGDVVGNSADNILIRDGNRIIVYEYSSYHVNGQMVFQGEINSWEADFGNTDEEEIQILVNSDGQELTNYLIQGATVTDVVQTSQNSFYTIDQTPKISQQLWVGQTFIPSGGVTNLAAIALKLACSFVASPTPVTVNVYSSVAAANAGSAPLTTQTQTVSSLTPTDFIFTFPLPVTTTPGVAVFFEVIVVDPNGDINVYYANNNPYANGDMYTSVSFGFRNYLVTPSGGVGTTSDLYFKTFFTAGSTNSTYTNEDPADIIRSIIDQYVSRGGSINYNSSSIDSTSLSVTYPFVTNTTLEGITTMKDLAPFNWYWFVDVGQNILYFKKTSALPQFILTKGVDIESLRLKATIENIINTDYFSGGLVGGNNLYSLYQDISSVQDFGVRLTRDSDNRVTLQSTADAKGNALIAENKDEQYQTSVTLVDQTVDISQYKVGQTVGFAGFGTFVDTLVLQIVRLEYSPEEITLTLGKLPPRLNPTLQQAVDDLVALQTIDNPSSPT